jgi:hypothetical protein
MRIVSAERLTHLLHAVPEAKRIICIGNAATPWTLMRVLDETLTFDSPDLQGAAMGGQDRVESARHCGGQEHHRVLQRFE